MTNTSDGGLQLEVSDTGEVWAEIVATLDEHAAIPCDFCNHEISTAERGTINADYVVKVGHSGAVYICDYCIDPEVWQ